MLSRVSSFSVPSFAVILAMHAKPEVENSAEFQKCRYVSYLTGSNSNMHVPVC